MVMKFDWSGLVVSLGFVGSFLLPFFATAKEDLVIENGRTIAIEYVLTLDDGTTVSSNVGREPLVYTHGSGSLLPALEAALAGLKEGDTKKVSLTAEEGYGPVNPNAFIEVPIDLVPADARKVDTLLVGRDPDGNEQQMRVHEVKDDKIVLDMNHPLAGKNLHFEVKILSVE